MKLGTKRPEPGEPIGKPASKETFPSFSVADDNAGKLMDEHELKMGSVITADVKLKVCAMSADDYGKRISFDVLELNDIGESEDDDQKTVKPKSMQDEMMDVQKGISEYEA